VLCAGFPIRGTTYTAPDLRDGTAYEFRVSAQNAAGRSDPSPATRPVVPRDADGAAPGATLGAGALVALPGAGAGPHVMVPLEETYAKIGDSVTLSCKIGGNPKPDITWSALLLHYQPIVDELNGGGFNCVHK
jgi:hypothetical protein